MLTYIISKDLLVKTFTAYLWWGFLGSAVVANRRPDNFLYMMPSNVTLKFKKMWKTNVCSSHIQIKFTITVFKCWKFKTQEKLLKIRTLDGDSNIQIRIQFREQNKIKINRRVICNFKMEPRTFTKSYTPAFKRRVLTRLEENDKNMAMTAHESNIHRKNLQRWNSQKDVNLKAVQNKRVGLLLYVLSKEFLPKTKNFPDAT